MNYKDAMNGNVSVPPKMRILLIDDKPEGLWNDSEPSLPEHPALPKELRTYFELRWIATAGEAREYIDLTRMIGRHNPSALGGAGTVPEIVVIDYSLTQDPRPVEQRLRQHAPELWKELSPLEPLRRIAESMGLPLPHKGEQYESQLKADGPTSTDDNQERKNDKEGENYGCFVGGLIISTFSDHPCAPVTVTIRQPEQLRGTHTGFFQWLMLTESTGTLHAVGRSGINWKRIAVQGVELLRNRIRQLAAIRAISLSLDELFHLKLGLDIGAITVQSRYGVRRLPLEGLFCDFPRDQVSHEARNWVVGKQRTLREESDKGLLEQLAEREHFEELNGAIALSDKLWDAYKNTDYIRARLRLASLFREFRTGKLPDTGELQGLWKRFSTMTFDPGTPSESLDKFIDIRFGYYSDLSRRWACLMVLVRLLKFRADALKQAEQSDDLSEENAWILGVIGRPLHEDDLYLALFPAAKNPVDLKNKTDLEATLKRLVPPLRVKDLLPKPVAPTTGEPLTVHGSSSSVSTKDRQVMEWYALSRVFPEAEWDEYTRSIIQGNA